MFWQKVSYNSKVTNFSMQALFTLVLSIFLMVNQSAYAHDPDEKYYQDAPAKIQQDPTVKSFFSNYCDKKKPTIVEFFSYACPGCYSAENYFNDYLAKNSDKVIFKRVPVVFRRGWDTFAKIYYAYEHMGVVEVLHTRTFLWVQDQLRAGNSITNDSIKEYLQETIANNEDVAKKLEGKFKMDDFMELISSPTINRDSKNGMRLFRAYQITTTPSIVVNNKYVITLDKAKNFENVIKTIEELSNEKTAC